MFYKVECDSRNQINFMPTKLPWNPIKFTVCSFKPNCTGPSLSRLKSARNRLLFFFTFWRLCLHWSICLFSLVALGCMSHDSPSFSAGQVTSSFTAETIAHEHNFVWWTNESIFFPLESVLFLTDSQSALPTFNDSSYLLPRSLWNVWFHTSSLSNSANLNFKWVSGHAGKSGNEHADYLAKAGASLPTAMVPYPRHYQKPLHSIS